MKETLFEMLLNLFETTLLRLKEVNVPENAGSHTARDEKARITSQFLNSQEKLPKNVYQMMIMKDASQDAMRVFTPDEQMKLSKASYQFLMRLHAWGVISRDVMELIINRLIISDSYVVSLQETKWVIRALLADKLSFDQLAYLDLVLYHNEDAIVRH